MVIAGRYQVESQLGEGGQGHVYRVRHIELGKHFALKIILPALAGNSVARARFNREAKLASEISHPNIVSVVDFGDDPEHGAFMVMELVHGEPLIGTGVLPMSIRAAVDVLRQVADAVEHIHKRRIIHGDIKAENLVLTEESQLDSRSGARRRKVVRLLDFGLASRHGQHEGGRVAGTPQYLAPERVVGAPMSVATDVYALGVLGYLLLTGTLPFEGTQMEVLMGHMHSTPEPMSLRRNEQVDSALEKLIARALEKDAATRHPTAAAFLYELNTAADMLGLSRRRTPTNLSIKTESPRTTSIKAAWDQSRAPQAIVSIEGDIVTCNLAFQKFVKSECENVTLADTLVARYVPGLMQAARMAHIGKTIAELKAEVSRGADRKPLHITLWFLPLPLVGQELHLIIRVEEIQA